MTYIIVSHVMIIWLCIQPLPGLSGPHGYFSTAVADGEMGEQQRDSEVSGLATLQLLRRCGDGRQPPEHRDPGGGAVRHRGERGAPDGDLHAKLGSVPQVHQKVSPQPRDCSSR